MLASISFWSRGAVAVAVATAVGVVLAVNEVGRAAHESVERRLERRLKDIETRGSV